MPITPVTAPNYYDMIVTYENNANPTIKWRTTFTFFSASLPVLGVGIVAALATFAVGLVHSDSSAILFDVYNWTRGRQPYPLGSPIISFPTSDIGTADLEWPALHTPYHPADGTQVLRMDHVPVSPGKAGRNFMRGILGTADIISVSGGPPVLTVAPITLQGNLNTFLLSSGLNAYFNAGVGGQHLAIVRYSKKLGLVTGNSEVSSFNVIDVTDNKLRRRNAR